MRNIHPTKEPNLHSANFGKPCKEVSGTELDTQRRCTQEYYISDEADVTNSEGSRQVTRPK
jgi:hypothetical protein